jgi:superfamily II DNA/RNA helicase
VDRATAIYHHLLRHGYSTTTLLHGTLPSSVREENFRAFASGVSNILVSTDMTARGLDLRVDKVINFDMPTSPIPYLNRAGRTARMGRTGDVISLYTKQQRVIVSALRKFIARRIRLEGVSNVASEMVRPRYAEWKLQKIDATARKFVQLVNTRIIPAHLEKTYIRHNAMWRPLFHPDTAGIHGGVPVRQQKKIKARVREAAIWFRRQKLADRKGGMAKFGRTKALVRRTDGAKGIQAGAPSAGAASLSRPMPRPPK